VRLEGPRETMEKRREGISIPQRCDWKPAGPDRRRGRL